MVNDQPKWPWIGAEHLYGAHVGSEYFITTVEDVDLYGVTGWPVYYWKWGNYASQAPVLLSAVRARPLPRRFRTALQFLRNLEQLKQ